MSRRRRLGIVVPALLALTVVGTYLADADDEPSLQPQPIAAEATAADSTSSVSELLGSVRTVDHLEKVEGYDRSCSKGHGCVFGPAWTDDSTAPGSHNGCDTRNDVLAAQLVDVRFKPGSYDCKVTAGVLDDPYTGTTIEDLADIQIDHVYPLARGWNAGAWAWPLDRRTAFANDLDSNLLAVDGRTNQQKSDKGIDTWLPPNTDGQCRYITAYLTVATQYGLDITTSDAAVATTVCTGRP